MKNGTANHQFNATHIDWDININRSLFDLNNVKLVDAVPAGLNIVESSIAISVVGGGAVPAHTIDVTRQTITINFTQNVEVELPPACLEVLSHMLLLYTKCRGRITG